MRFGVRSVRGKVGDNGIDFTHDAVKSRFNSLQPDFNTIQKAVSRNERDDATDPKGLNKIKRLSNQTHSPGWLELSIWISLRSLRRRVSNCRFKD